MKKESVTIIGGGLSGLTAALYLADVGADVTVLEQGKEYEDRRVENSAEVLVGLGGAGTVSGGKLCFPPASGGIWQKTQDSLYKFRPFYREMFAGMNTLFVLPQQKDTDLGSCAMVHKAYHTEIALKDTMYDFVTSLIHNVKCKGVTVRCGCRVEKLNYAMEGSEITFRNENGEQERLSSVYVILATGRTSVSFLQDSFGLNHNHQPDLGIRLTLDTKQPAFSIIGEDVKLKLKLGNYLIRTFCVCCGGDSIRTSTNGYVHYDGHFESQLTNRTNMGILARSPMHSGPEAAEHYLRAMQNYVDAEISLKDFCKYRDLLTKGTIYGPLFEALAAFILELYRSGMLTQNADEIPVLLPSVDRFNPLIQTNDSFESFLPHVYVTGDAAGLSRGFVQAMWSGYCAAERIIGKMVCAKQNWKVV